MNHSENVMPIDILRSFRYKFKTTNISGDMICEVTILCLLSYTCHARLNETMRHIIKYTLNSDCCLLDGRADRKISRFHNYDAKYTKLWHRNITRNTI